MTRLLQKLSVLCLLVMVSAATWADQVEKTIIKTSFKDWANYEVCVDKGASTDTTGVITTAYSNEEVKFYLHNANVYTGGKGKVGDICADPSKYICGMKQSSDIATITTSAISSVTSLLFTEGATGSNRGWGLKVKGTKADGTVDEDWVTVFSTTIGKKCVPIDTIKINRTNVQLQWYNLSVGNYAALTDLVILGNVEIAPRTFTDFKVDFRVKSGDNNYTVVTPEAGLPSGVAVTTKGWNGNQHGATGATVTVSVDGPVKFLIGGCQYSNKATVSVDGGDAIDIDTKSAGCENAVSDIANATYDKYATYTYNVEKAATLTFDLGNYCPYFIAEKCDYVANVTVSYYNTDGKLIGEEAVEGGSKLAYKYGASDVTVAEGFAFRGWFAANSLTATKVLEGVALDADTKLYAKTSAIENAVVGTHFDWDLTKSYWYDEDHEAISMPKGAYHDGSHGWQVAKTNSIKIAVGGKALVSIKNCIFSATQTATVTNMAGEQISTVDLVKNETTDGTVWSFKYDGTAPDTLTVTYPSGAYVHGVEVYNVAEFVEKDAAGYYEVPAGDGATAMMLIKTAQSGDKIYLPNGTYDFGNTCLTSVPSGVSIIGESQDGVIIQNTPLEEGISATATLLLTGNNIYLQDLSLKCINTLCKTSSAERCVALQDKGTNNICKNVSLLSTQDTYYSCGGAQQRAYFEDCYVTGTVDYLCGGGDIVFNRMKHYILSRSSANVIVAANTDANTKWGYVLLDNTIDCDASQVGKYDFGRPWNNSPAATWINAKMLQTGDDAGYRNMTDKLTIRYHEYNTQDADGNVITTHNLTACKGTDASDAIYLDADAAAKYTIANVFAAGVYDGVEAWDPEAQTKQIEDVTAGTVYLVDGKITTTLPSVGAVRVANARGGFGPEIKINSIEEKSYKVKAEVSIDSDQRATNLDQTIPVTFNTTNKTAKVTLPAAEAGSWKMAETPVAGVSYTVADGKYSFTLPAATINFTNGTETVVATVVPAKSSCTIQDSKLNATIVATSSKGTITVVYNADNAEAPTAVANVEAASDAKAEGKFIKNGQVVIFSNGKQYNAAGAQMK